MRSACLLMLPDASCHLSLSSLSTNDLTDEEKAEVGTNQSVFHARQCESLQRSSVSAAAAH